MIPTIRFHPYLFFLSSLFLCVHLVFATRFSVSVNRVFFFNPKRDEDESRYLQFSTPLNHVFGLSPDGQVTASLDFFHNLTTSPCPARLSLCQVSSSFVRGPNYQRRQPRPPLSSLNSAFVTTACDSDREVTQQDHDTISDPETGLAWCISQDLCISESNYRYSVNADNLQPNEMYFLGAAVCGGNLASDQGVYLNISLTGDIEFRNPDLLFPQLGFEEVLFPVFSATIMVLLGPSFVLLALALFIARHRSMPICYTVQYVVGAIFLKLAAATLTFVHFYTLAQSGKRQAWYLYVRLLLASSADIFFIIAFISISSGYSVMPNSWFVEDRLPVFLVYIGIVLQLLIIIAVKILFPFQYLGAVTYTIAGSAIALIASFSSYRNYRFLQRFGRLIERSHIFLKSTPIGQMRRFYAANVVIAAVAYLIKIISVSLFDYRLNRPDLLWGFMESVDAVLLLWFALFIFPYPRSALYVDMSNLSNERLHEAERWRARQGGRQTSNETIPSSSSGDISAIVQQERDTEPSAMTPTRDYVSSASAVREDHTESLFSRTAERFLRPEGVRQIRSRFGPPRNAAFETVDFAVEAGGNGSLPQPPWIAWTPGASLPRPTSYTWRGRRQDARNLRRGGSITPFVQTPIVVGSPKGPSDMVVLMVGIPVTGANSVPKAFDEKGAEITDSSLLQSARDQSSTSVSAQDIHADSRSSRANLGTTFGLSTRRHNRYGQENRDSGDMRGQQTLNSLVLQPASSQIPDSYREPEMGQARRSLSSSNTTASCDGTVSTSWS